MVTTTSTAFFTKVINFIKKNYKKNPKYLLFYAYAYFLPNFSFTIDFYSGEEIQKMIEEGKSMIRYGDGEVWLMNHGNLGFQKFDQRIRKGLFDGFLQYNNNSPYIVGVNELVMDKTNTFLKQNNAFRLWLPMKVYYFMYFPKKMRYMDASFFYYNENVQTYLVPVLANKEIIFVSRKETLDTIKNNPAFPYLTHSHFIETKSSNAFDDYDTICASIDTIIASLPKGSRPLIIAAFGAGTKVLAYEYSAKGIQTLDIGTGIEILYQDKRIDGILMPKNK
jgi:hypothetical protein